MRRLFSLPLLLLLAACGGSAAAGTLATRTDSAGITIITNTDPSWRAGDGWQVSAEPVLEIGPRDDDDPRYDFLRVSGGTILPSGEIVVLVASRREIRVFSPDGSWLRTIGREGEGPGEMRAPGAFAHSADTLFLTDVMLSRLTAFSTAGELHTTWSFPTIEGAGRLQPEYRLADGTWVASGSRVSFGGEGMPREGLNRPPVTYFRLSADLASVLDTLAETSGWEVRIATSGSSPTGGPMMVMFRPPPLARTAPTTATATHFVWGDNAAPELRFHSADGTLETILRWSPPAVPADAALLERMKQAALSRATNDQARERIEAEYTEGTPAPVVPYFSSLRQDRENHLWVQELAPIQTDSVRLHIFDPDGQYLGQRTLPPRHRILEIGADYLLTIWQDDDDLEYLRVYRLRR